MLFQKGFQVGNYKITSNKTIGRGSFSYVYPASKEQNSLWGTSTEKVAIKIISIIELGKMKERLKYEIEVMKQLDHPNVIRLLDVIYQDDYVFLVLNFCKNGDLHKFLNGRPLKSKYARFYLKQMAQGLQYLYERNIIHRDLKPQNLLLDDTYTLKITDFGFAKYFDSGGMSETICGTPLYMAPEIMKFKKYSIKSDLWSVGVILYEMIVGRTPYKAQNHMELLHKINTQAVIVPIYLDVPEGCQNLIRGLLQKNPKDRMNWEQFFGHPWVLSEQGMGGMDISILASPKTENLAFSQIQFPDGKNISQRQFLTQEEESTHIFSNQQPSENNPIINFIDNYDGKEKQKLNSSVEIDNTEDKEDREEGIFSVDCASSSSSDYYSCDNDIFDNDEQNIPHDHDELSLSDGDEDIILPSNIEEKITKRPTASKPISINSQGLGIKYNGGRIIAEEPGFYSLQEKRDLFLPIVGKTPRKENGFVVVETPQEYDIVSDILKNEKRMLSESMMDYMSDTYHYLRSFWKKSKSGKYL